MMEPLLNAPMSATADVRLVLIAMAYLLVKHCAADFLLQTETQRHSKGIYGAMGGITHAATHILLTAPVFLILPPIGATAIAGLLAAEFVIHYHLDWTKEQIINRNHWGPSEPQFWWALGIDQLGHGLTYVGLLWLALGLAAY